MLLELRDMVTGYGRGEVLHGVSMNVNRGEMVGLIGPNGAGKSTIFKAISGLLKIKRGKRIFEGKDVTDLPAYKISHLGLTQVPEGRQIIPTLTVRQNLYLGCYPKYRSLGQSGRENLIERVFSVFPRLSERTNQLGGTLSGGEQQMLAIGRALMAEPKLVLFDEPSLGLAPLVVDSIYKVMSELKNQGMTILLAEQNAVKALELTDRSYLVEDGVIAVEGPSKEMAENENVRKVYLGGI